jgi:mono/diheme cytochrome c family protein
MERVMERAQRRNARKIIVGLLAVSLLGISGIPWMSQAADETSSKSGTAASDGEAASKDGACCKPGDTTPPPELVANTPKGQLKNPYQDFAKVADDGHHQFMLPGCNECHGGTGGGGICPPLNQGVWFWGSDDDTLFRLVTLGSQALQKEGYQRLGEGTVKGPMPAMGTTIKTSDDLWKIIAWIRSINPPPTPPPPP